MRSEIDNMKNTTTTTWSFTVAFGAMATLAILALSCSAKVGEPPAPSGMEPGSGTDPGNGNPGTGTEPTTPASPAMPSMPSMPTTDPLPTPGGVNNPGETTTPIETPVTPPPASVLDAEKALQAKLDGMTAAVPGTSVKFINCNETPYTARLESRTLSALRDLLAAISADNQGRISFAVHESLGGYMGQTYFADVTLGTDQSRPVPTDAAELVIE